MDYEKIYQEFYSKYYNKAEILVKNLLIKSKSKDKNFGVPYKQVNNYLSDTLKKKYNLYENDKLTELYQIFDQRYREYEKDEIQKIFANEIEIAFSKIETLELPTNYTYFKLIKEIAIIEIINELHRLWSNNSRLIEMYYKLNNFDEFELREYRGVSIENYPVYKKLHQKLHPEYYIPFEENKNEFSKLFVNSDVYNCFLNYQKHIIEFYTDYSYLKKRMESEKLIHYHKDNEFMKIVYEEINLISKKNYDEYYIHGKLKSLEKSFSTQRYNNFNIVFKDVL